MTRGQFLGVTKNFEHRVDAEGALTEANQAHARRYLHLSEPQNGMVRIDGLLDAEGGATVRSALEPFMMPLKDDPRRYGQRQHDALIELCHQRASGKRDGAGGKRDGAGPRPQLIIRASLDTLAGIPGAPAGELDGGGTVPAAMVQRYACDSAIIRMAGRGELEHELNHATRTIPPSTRGRSNPATSTASFKAATGGRAGATDITWSGGSKAARQRYPTWRYSAGRITE